MGDRGNIVVVGADGRKDQVWFYTHWSGSTVRQVVRDALARRLRWNDSSYLARIIFDTLTAGEQGKETGFGISSRLQDNSHDIVVVDAGEQCVYLVSEKAVSEDGKIVTGPGDDFWSFDEFSKLDASEGN